MGVRNLNHINDISTKQKLIELLKIKDKLVLCQVHCLEQILEVYSKTYKQRFKEEDDSFIITIYDHYIVNGLPKTYLVKRGIEIVKK